MEFLKVWRIILLILAYFCAGMWVVAMVKHDPDHQFFAVWGALFFIFYRLRVLESRA